MRRFAGSPRASCRIAARRRALSSSWRLLDCRPRACFRSAGFGPSTILRRPASVRSSWRTAEIPINSRLFEYKAPDPAAGHLPPGYVGGRVNYNLFDSLWNSIGFPLDFLKIIVWFAEDFLRISFGIFRVSLGCPLDFLWISFGFPMDSLPMSYKCPMDVQRIFFDFLWISYGFIDSL